MIFFTCAVWVLSSALWWQPPPRDANPDMALIEQHVFNERAAELASLLELSEAQVKKLKAVRATVDELHRIYEPAILEARKAVDEKAAEVRRGLEEGRSMSEQDKKALRALRAEHDQSHHRLHRAKRGEIRQLHELLNEEQRTKANTFLARHDLDHPPGRPPHRRPRERGIGPLGRRGGPPHKQRGKMMRVHKVLVQFMLSDAFLKEYP
ncbi:hypothetical protein [Acanthopleuribacter pedis]|uniref:Uncharacterized protein n=1 Tax=Acanthopleuribacter pedis TaxID=442870 RepID=A0A8J7Q4K2_9BACT|nr:hypothetical protein [Acanthopleuribacter pedis]MBO1317656.1 hypothetical protein [Acanthopleuribacter pedis]